MRKEKQVLLTEPDEVTPLWSQGPELGKENTGPEVAFRGPMATATDTLMLRNVTEPTLSVFRPTTRNGVAVLVCPGGGWRILTWEHEGLEAVQWLTARGYTAFLLKYRLGQTPPGDAEFQAYMAELIAATDGGRSGRDAPRSMADLYSGAVPDARDVATDDARRALSIIRERAADWGIDQNKVGMLGFSVGACIVADIAVDPRAQPLAFAAPIYGGDTGRPVPVDAPPLFIVSAQDDPLACRVSETLYGEWTDAQREAELHIFRKGGHSFGFTKQNLASDRWTELFEQWLSDLALS